jgi:ABC-2 type transport system permease protein
MNRTLLAKEFLEQRRTYRVFILGAVLLVFGLISPVLAKYTPLLLRSIPNLPAGLAGIIPEATIRDAVGQYIKNISQFGVFLVIIFSMGVIAQEKERGTAAMLLTKPVRRSAMVLAKWVAGMASLLVGLAVAAIGCALYTALLFEPLPLAGFLALNALMAVFLSVFLSVALLASALARSQAAAAGIAFGGLLLLLVLASIPRLGEIMPNQLLGWGEALVLGGDTTAWTALAVSIGIIALSLAGACLRLEHEEI